MLKSNDIGTNKLADTQYPIHDLLRQRWSPLAFQNRWLNQKNYVLL
jgi:hypothetical protein